MGTISRLLLALVLAVRFSFWSCIGAALLSLIFILFLDVLNVAALQQLIPALESVHLAFIVLAGASFIFAAKMAVTDLRLLRVLLGSYSESQTIEPVPGAGPRRLAQLWFSKKVYTLVFEPILSDLQHEYIEALAENNFWKARFVLVRGYWAFWLAVVSQFPVSLFRVVFEMWKATKIG